MLYAGSYCRFIFNFHLNCGMNQLLIYSYTVFCLMAIFIEAHSPYKPYALPIRIGLSVDSISIKDLIIVINSAINTAYDKY